jgi:hypothetical protein
LGLTGTERGIYTVLIFIIAYGFVMAEEFTGLRKSKPVIRHTKQRSKNQK